MSSVVINVAALFLEVEVVGDGSRRGGVVGGSSGAQRHQQRMGKEQWSWEREREMGELREAGLNGFTKSCLHEQMRGRRSGAQRDRIEGGSAQADEGGEGEAGLGEGEWRGAGFKSWPSCLKLSAEWVQIEKTGGGKGVHCGLGDVNIAMPSGTGGKGSSKLSYDIVAEIVADFIELYLLESGNSVIKSIFYQTCSGTTFGWRGLQGLAGNDFILWQVGHAATYFLASFSNMTFLHIITKTLKVSLGPLEYCKQRGNTSVSKHHALQLINGYECKSVTKTVDSTKVLVTFDRMWSHEEVENTVPKDSKVKKRRISTDQHLALAAISLQPTSDC
ncbi:hypothetical protein C8J57DRAFT_1234300 [Mycena rebaudengoi]|nr:hypothetical protein C8J57DRAFT_1234300 [Mycena rebaudengoi]